MNVITFILILILIAALGVVLIRDPIHSVILLVTAFIYTAILFYIIGAEFLAVLFMTVYIGAIAVLFLFVIMLLNLRMVELYTSLYYHLPVGVLLVSALIWFIYFIFTPETGNIIHNSYNVYMYDKYMHYLTFTTNISVIGEVLYNYNIDIFAIAGAILFIGMVGVIILTLGLEHQYRPHYEISKISARDIHREVYANIIWENINVITKNRNSAQPYMYNEQMAVDITKIKLIPHLHLPKWVKKLMVKYIKED